MSIRRILGLYCIATMMTCSYGWCASASRTVKSTDVLKTIKKRKIPKTPDQLHDLQYKKQNRDQITRIALGEPAAAAKYYESYLQVIPDDVESMYGLVLAETQIGDFDKAMKYLNMSLDHGLPFERYLAGPRDLLKPLYDHAAFKRMVADRNIHLIHGPFVGAVSDSTAKIWLRTWKESAVRVEVEPAGGNKKNRVTATGHTRAKDDYTCVINVSGLSPSTEYAYSLFIDGVKIDVSPRTTFRTFPKLGQSGRFTVGFGGGAGYTPWNERMWTLLRDQHLDAFLLMGDNVYIDTPEVGDTQRYCYYRRQSRPEYRGFVASTPIFAIWDDHDFGTNDCEGGPAVNVPAWKPRVLKVFKQNYANPFYGTDPKTPGIWFDMSYGDVDFFFLDCRYYRSLDSAKTNRTMLGPVQRAWLLDRLKHSHATFKVIASSVPWASGVKPGSIDPWDGFPEEREKIFSFIEQNDIDGVVLISADRHRSDAWQIHRKNGYDLYDFMSSKLTNFVKHSIIKGCLFGYNEKCSFGKLEFDTAKPDPEVTYTIVNIDGKKINSLKLNLSQLKHK